MQRQQPTTKEHLERSRTAKTAAVTLAFSSHSHPYWTTNLDFSRITDTQWSAYHDLVQDTLPPHLLAEITNLCDNVASSKKVLTAAAFHKSRHHTFNRIQTLYANLSDVVYAAAEETLLPESHRHARPPPPHASARANAASDERDMRQSAEEASLTRFLRRIAPFLRSVMTLQQAQSPAVFRSTPLFHHMRLHLQSIPAQCLHPHQQSPQEEIALPPPPPTPDSPFDTWRSWTTAFLRTHRTHVNTRNSLRTARRADARTTYFSQRHYHATINETYRATKGWNGKKKAAGPCLLTAWTTQNDHKGTSSVALKAASSHPPPPHVKGAALRHM